MKQIKDEFPSVSHITGVDIDWTRVREAQKRFAGDDNIEVYHSSAIDFESIVRFDIITCFNVLCTFPTPKHLMDMIDFDTYSKMILKLVHLLRHGGVLLIYGANYSLSDVRIPAGFSLLNLNTSSGKVPIFTPDKVQKPSDNDSVYIIRREKHVSVKGNRMLRMCHVKGQKEQDSHCVQRENEHYNSAPAKANVTQTKCVTAADRQTVQVSLPQRLEVYKTPVMTLKEPQEYQHSLHSESHKPTPHALQYRNSSSSPCPSTSLDTLPSSSLNERQVVTFGIYQYKNSRNIGDYIQTLAQINVMSSFYTKKWHMPSPAVRAVFEHFSSTKPNGAAVRNRHHRAVVHVVWIARDGSWDHNIDELPSTPVYCVANGWYMHETNGKIQFPFADFVHPWFVSVHLAKHNKILEQHGAEEYLRKWGPIGCRDTDTRDILLSRNIPAYFSSCMTTTLENPVLDGKVASLSFNLDMHHMFRNKDSQNRSHTIPGLQGWSLDKALGTALAYLVEYSNAETIRSTRIHCLLPARACGDAQLEFCSPTTDQSPSWHARSRFSGLTGVMRDEVQRNMNAMIMYEELVDKIAELLVGPTIGPSVPNLDLSVIDTRAFPIQALRVSHPGLIRARTDQILERFNQIKKIQTVEPTVFDYVIRRCPFKAFSGTIDIIVTFDLNFIKIVPRFLYHLAKSNPDPLLRIFCITRNVSTEVFRGIGPVPRNVAMFQFFGEAFPFKDYSTPLHHVSKSCMDRLLMTQIDYAGLNVNRVIYIDLDMLIIGDLRPLLELDSGVVGIIAKSSIIQNLIQKWLIVSNVPTSTLTYKSDKSFNAGFLVVDLHKLRAHNFFIRILQMLEKVHMNDQILLNMYCDGTYRELPPQYNIFVGQDDKSYTPVQGVKNSASCYHFVGSKKPWLYNREDYQYNKLLWDIWKSDTPSAQILFIPG
jgi:lipopolysaccharide biosynthesis glycosyltransferase